ncbi:hypothetical protein THTE_1198 [Thermogutta terrifontis]|jgi:putative FmdB family regulatory protein|uniref:Putative regulatory protein FmdB zinc ribbon domain-containing protein n=1 Tax=Thermogutta terrifontis TaxID=1331910 RepID=A0A286RCW7_9BACT|nr:zinc ribbon domain-containing protein [Thermogutta terrifontis]ASV73800.1 hypothetical protein THTE_1198 [Thermogutta terrifontis]
MPIYEYTCEKCGAHFELLIRNNEQPRCPQCGTTDVLKQLSKPAISISMGGSSAESTPPCGAPPGCCGGNCNLFDQN